MSKQFDSIMRGLEQVAAYKKGDVSKCRVKLVTVPDIEPLADFPKEKIREIRQRMNLPQKYFAEVVGVSPSAVEAWEAGTRKPTGSAKRLFQLMEKDPNLINTIR